MNAYRITCNPDTLAVLDRLSAGVTTARIGKDFPDSSTCTSCWLRTTSGDWIELQATEEGLEFKFEVFPLTARIVAEPENAERHEMTLTAPVDVAPLVSDSWLDPTAATCPTLGSDPVMQFSGPPDSAPATASAVCHYMGGVELGGANGRKLVIATASFPYALHVSGIYEDRFFNRGHYVRLPAR